MNLRLILLLPFLFSACLHPKEPVENVSMVQVIAKPGQYSGSKLRLSGSLILEHEEYRLYLDDYNSYWGISVNSVWLELTKAQKDKWNDMNGRTVLVEGIFFHDQQVENRYGLKLKNITRITNRINRDEIIEMINKSKAEYNNGKDPESRIK